MKTLILFVLCLLLLPALPALGSDDPCWCCWDALGLCEEGDGQACCKDAKREYCRGCDDCETAYRYCLASVKEPSSYQKYLRNRSKERFGELRQKYMDEMDK